MRRTFLALLLVAAAASHAVSPPLCTVRSPLDDGRLRFEASDGQELLSAVWAPRRDGLSGCSLSAEPPAVSAFLSRCRRGEGLREGRPAFSSLREAKAACRPVQPPAGSGPRRRTKRGFTYPGTLWCGAGNIAESYDQLGAHQETDKCCREHDQCHHVIHPFTYKYGHRNFRWHTISHCDCDNRLKACLRAVNNTASRVVGQAFFNVIQVPCFEFTYKEQCVEPYLYVWCKNYSTVAIAVLQDPVLYDYGGQRIDWPATYRPTSTATPDSSHTQPLVTSAAPTQKPEPAILEVTTSPATRPRRPGKKRQKGKGKGREKNKKEKGLKKKRKRKKKKEETAKSGSLPILHALGEDSTSSPKDLDRQEVGKVEFGEAARLSNLGEEDPHNAVLGDDPAGAAPQSTGDAAQAESKQPTRQRTASESSSVQTSKRKKERKGRRPSQQGGEAAGTLQAQRRREGQGRDPLPMLGPRNKTTSRVRPKDVPN